MRRLPSLRRTIQHDPDGARVQRDVDDEIRFHLDAVTAELVASGLSPDAARQEAERRFGDRERHRHALESEDRAGIVRRRWHERLTDATADIRQSMRTLVREPLFTLGVVATLGVGLAANATMFGIIDRLLLQPPAHVSGDANMTLVYFNKPQRGNAWFTQSSTSWPDFVTLRDSAGVFDAVAAFWLTDGSLDRGAAATKLRLGLASGDFFRVLGTRPERGRFFNISDDDPAATEQVAVISYTLWRDHFGGDSKILGRTLNIDQRTFTVIGVAPLGFHGPQARRVDVWLPARSVAQGYLGKNWETTRNMYWVRIVGRLRSDVSRSVAEERATVLHQRSNRVALKGDSVARVAFGSIVAARGATTPAGSASVVSPLSGVSPQGRVATWLAGVAAIVLLIVCANTANLFLARHDRRRREIAVRLAIGVRRGRLVRLLVNEAMLLAAAAAAVALVLTWWGTALMRSTLLASYAWETPALDLRVVGFTAITAVVTALLSGLVPALVSSRQDLATALKSGTKGSGRRRSALQRVLLMTQASLSMLLLVGAGLFIRSLGNVSSLRLGYEADSVLVANIDIGSRLTGESDFSQFYVDASEAVRTIPGVTSADIAVTTPFASSWAVDLFVPGYDSLPDIGDGYYVNAVSSSWFETMGTRILRGRGFKPTDVKGSERVAVVNAYMAKVLWPGQDAIGKCIKVQEATAPCATVVGVMENTYRDNLRETTPAQYVVPLDQGTFDVPMRSLFIRVRGLPSGLIPVIRERLQTLRADLPFADVRPMRAFMDGEVEQWRLGATMFGLFGLIALLVAAIGLYALVAYDVAQRWHELGVRSALGASPHHLRGIIVRAGVLDAAIGLTMGGIIAALVAPVVEDLLFNVQPRDVSVYAMVSAALLGTSLLAALLPALRAGRVVPAHVLRTD